MKKKLVSLALSCCFLGMAIPASANLVDLGHDLIYDDAQDITWYDYNFDPHLDDFPTTFLWADNLEYMGITDWRIPTLNEWSNLRSETMIGGVVDFSPFNNLGPFNGVTPSGTAYLTSTWVTVPWDPPGTTRDYPYVFFLGDGSYVPALELWAYGMAVTDGRFVPEDGTAPVPEPATMLLVGVGLAGFGFKSTRRRKQNARTKGSHRFPA